MPEGDTVGFHELVRERATAWMDAHVEERGGRTEVELWQAYGERYAAAFAALGSSGERGSRARAAEAGRRGIAYLTRARSFERLAGFASAVVTGTRDPSLLRAAIADLQAIAEEVSAGRDRWSLRTFLADALVNSGRPDAGLRLLTTRRRLRPR